MPARSQCVRVIDHGWRQKGVKSRMTHQVKKKKLTTVLVHIHRSHAEKATKLFAITNSQGPNHDLQERRFQTAVMHRTETRHFLFQKTQEYNRNNGETTYFSPPGWLSFHMKGKIGWWQQSSKYTIPKPGEFPILCLLAKEISLYVKMTTSRMMFCSPCLLYLHVLWNSN